VDETDGAVVSPGRAARVSVLLARFGVREERVDRSAFDGVVALGEAAVRPLEGKFRSSEDIWVRSEICLALAAIGSSEAVPFLIDVLGDEDSFNFHTNRFVVYALGELRDVRAVGPLLKEIRAPDDRFTLMVDRADSRDAQRLQEELIADPDERFPLRSNDLIIRSLGKIGGQEALDAVKTMEESSEGGDYSEAELRRAIERMERQGQ
jgi:HEAT repeat protein